MQGDITAIVDTNQNFMATYAYDAWGNILSVNNLTSDNIGTLNPLRYRGYYYDTESGFYYLQSRYYDPAIGRFINIDGLVSTGTGFLGYNMFAYCDNNPIKFIDIKGNRQVVGTNVGNRETKEERDLSFAAANNRTANSTSNRNSPVIAQKIDRNSPPDHPNYKPSKKGPRKVKNPNGNNKGWEAEDGGVWIPVDNMHGGEGWIIQYPNGKHSHAYPGGGVRQHYEIDYSFDQIASFFPVVF